MTSLAIPAALAVGIVVGLVLGMSAGATYAREEPTKREEALTHALAMARHAERLPAIFWVVLEQYIAEQMTSDNHPTTDEGDENSGPEPGHPDGGTPA